jgi:hypothetical protein
VLSSLAIALLEGLGKVQDVRETICEGESLQAATELAGLLAKRLADLHSEVPLLVALG